MSYLRNSGGTETDNPGTYNNTYNNRPKNDNRPGNAEPVKSFPAKS